MSDEKPNVQENAGQKPLFKKIAQIGLVVKNAEETARRCQEDLGIGPWTFIKFDPSNVSEMTVHGKRVDHAMYTGHAKFGDIDWEIIEPLDDKSIYAEHLRAHGEGLHHILFDVDDYDDVEAQLCEKGFPQITKGNWDGDRYSYFDTRRALGCFAEIFSRPKASE